MEEKMNAQINNDKYGDVLEFITIEEEEELIAKLGTEPIVHLVSNNAALYINGFVAKLIGTDYVTIAKAGEYLTFRECNNKKGFKMCRRKGSCGASIPMSGVLSKTGIRPEQVHGKMPYKIDRGFAIKLY